MNLFNSFMVIALVCKPPINAKIAWNLLRHECNGLFTSPVFPQCNMQISVSKENSPFEKVFWWIIKEPFLRQAYKLRKLSFNPISSWLSCIPTRGLDLQSSETIVLTYQITNNRNFSKFITKPL